MAKSLKHLTERAAEYSNISDSLDYELRGKRKQTWDGRWIMAHRERVIRATQQSILDGTFSPGKYRERTICERGKQRTIQSISLLRSIGIHAVMKVVEGDMDKTLISDTAASIKTREGKDRYVVLIDTQEGERKFFTNNDKMKQALDMARDKNMLPFTATIKADGGYGYIFT